jgi:hypothetical protein
MAALFDLHIQFALQNAWLRMTGAATTADDGKVNFRRCFPLVEDAVVDEWFTALTAKPVKVRGHASPGQDDWPLVVVKLEAETPQNEFLGSAQRPFLEGGVYKGRDVLGNIVAQEVDIYCGTTSHELTRALYVVVRALLHRLVPTLLGAGYLDVKFVSAQELMPDERLISEDAGVFVRHMRWRAISQIEAYPIEEGAVDAPDSWYINVSDIPGGKVGGMS